MKVTYDAETDSLTIVLRGERIKESDEVRPGVVADFGYDGGVVRFEILRASRVVDSAREMQFVYDDKAASSGRLFGPDDQAPAPEG